MGFSMLQCPDNLLLRIVLVLGIQRSQQTPMWVQARCPTRHRPSGVMQLPDDKRLLARKSGRGAPLIRVAFKDPYKYRKNTQTFVAAEGTTTGQSVYCGNKATLHIGNVLPIGNMPEG